MNEILYNKFYRKPKIYVEFSNETANIPYENSRGSFKYKMQFWFSFSIALLFLLIYILNIIAANSKEKISKQLLANYRLTTIYQASNSSTSNNFRSVTFCYWNN